MWSAEDGTRSTEVGNEAEGVSSVEVWCSACWLLMLLLVTGDEGGVLGCMGCRGRKGERRYSNHWADHTYIPVELCVSGNRDHPVIETGKHC